MPQVYMDPDGRNMDPKAKIVEVMSRRLPLNRLGLPDGIFRADFLPLPESGTERAQLAELNTNTAEPGAPDGGSRKSLPSPTKSLLAAATGDLDAAELAEDGDGQTSWDPDLTNPTSGRDLIKASREDRQRLLDSQLIASLDPKMLEKAYQPLHYPEGYPVQANGMPFWACLPFEPPHANELFEVYLGLEEEYGLRQLHMVPKGAVENQVNGYSVSNVPDLEKITEYFHLYYWKWRSQAFDMFSTAVRQRKRARKALAIEETQAEKSEYMLKRLFEEYFENDEFWETLTPQAAVKMLETLWRTQRLAAGLSVTGPTGGKGETSATQISSVEVQLRTIAERGGHSPDTTLSNDEALRIEEAFRSEVLANPEALQHAQELIVRIGTKKSSEHGDSSI